MTVLDTSRCEENICREHIVMLTNLFYFRRHLHSLDIQMSFTPNILHEYTHFHSLSYSDMNLTSSLLIMKIFSSIPVMNLFPFSIEIVSSIHEHF